MTPDRITDDGLITFLPAYLGGGAVGGLEHRVAGLVVDVGAGGDADAAHLSRQRVRNVVAVQIHGRHHVEFRRAGQHLLQEDVGDGVLDQDLAGRYVAAVDVVPRDRLVGMVFGRHLVAPLPERALGELLDVALVHQGDAAAVVLDGVVDRRAHQPLGAGAADRLDADAPESGRTAQPNSSLRKRSSLAASALPAATSKPAYTSSVFSRNTTMSTSSGRRTGEGTPG